MPNFGQWWKQSNRKIMCTSMFTVLLGDMGFEYDQAVDFIAQTGFFSAEEIQKLKMWPMETKAFITEYLRTNKDANLLTALWALWRSVIAQGKSAAANVYQTMR